MFLTRWFLFCRGANSAAATTESSMIKMQDRAETKETNCQSSVVGGEVEVLTQNATSS